MKNLSFRNKLLFTILPVKIVTIGALTMISYRIASKTIMSQNEYYLEQMVQSVMEFFKVQNTLSETLSHQEHILETDQTRPVEEVETKHVNGNGNGIGDGSGNGHEKLVLSEVDGSTRDVLNLLANGTHQDELDAEFERY